MKKKNKSFIFLIILIIIILCFIFGFVLLRRDNIYTISEKKWIEDNKNKVIDISVLTDVPVLNYNGDGLLFSYFDDFEKDMGLKFNKTAYKLNGSVDNQYVFKIVDKCEDNQILFYQDNYILITKNNVLYTDLNDISNLKIGILSTDLDLFVNSFNNVEFVSFDSLDELHNSLIGDESSVDGIITLKTLSLKFLVDNDFRIGYHFINNTKDYVIELNGDENLNNILRKYYDNWKQKKYILEYNSNLLNTYYELKQIKDSDRTAVKSRKYVYGFVENGIFDNLSSSNLKGINQLVLKEFSDFSGVSITYKKYNSISELLEGFNNSKVDVFYNTSNIDLNNNGITTYDGINNKLAVVSSYNNSIKIDSLNSLRGNDVALVEGCSIENLLSNYNVNIHKYKNMKQLLKNSKENELIVMNIDNYNYYKGDDLIDYKIDYILEDIVNNKYVVNSNEKLFANLFDFYINYTSTDRIISDNYDIIAFKNINYLFILLVVLIFVIITLVLISINKVKKYLIERKKKKRMNLSKSDKLKYIDQLTSLKNRTYLNSKIESWDNSEVYPQSIVIVDLNNVSFINDNYGREEGDRVIVEAASILINNQLPNSEIIRTDGNEFLIYLVGYSEKHIISYLRNLSREMKKLSHGFGAATGYSMINDGIKTVDDAVNEATLDMKNNKEDIDY